MEIGSKITVPVNCGFCESARRTGRVVYIHPERRYVVVEFDYSTAGRFYGERWNRKFRECYPLVPPKEKLCSSMQIPLPPGRIKYGKYDK